jgi:uncharacterized protein
MSKIPQSPIPLAANRALAIHAQALDQPPEAIPSGPDAICDLVERLGCVQIDTLHMVARSQYLVLWSRLGQYDPADLDALIFDPDQRRLYEYWKKAACIIPLRDYRYSLPRMRRYQENPRKDWANWIKEAENIDLIEEVKARIAAEGPLRVSDFKYDGPKRGSWWDWKPAKGALEHLYNTGELMISDRVNFHRVYDLRERVLPAWVDQTEPTADEANRHDVEQAVRCLGICGVLHVEWYAYIKRSIVRPVIQALVKEGILIEVEAETFNGDAAAMILHRDRLPDLQRALDGDLQPQHTTFLSPFDSLFWAQGRDMALWNFNKLIEMYVPEAKRIYGYFSMPILHRDRLVGRFDPRLDRKTGTLVLRSLHLEPGIEPDDLLVRDVSTALRDFIAFHDATDLVIERKGHKDFRKKLLERF